MMGDMSEAYRGLSKKDQGSIIRDAMAIFPGTPESNKPDEALWEFKSIRLNSYNYQKVIKALGDRDDVERYDLEEFGKGHPNNTTILRVKPQDSVPVS